MLHFWSLAIEEQFYLVFPVVVAGGAGRSAGARARCSPASWWSPSLVSLSLMWVLYTPGQDPSRVYYGTGTRAFELLLGAILALVPLAPGRVRAAHPEVGVGRGRRHRGRGHPAAVGHRPAIVARGSTAAAWPATR